MRRTHRHEYERIDRVLENQQNADRVSAAAVELSGRQRITAIVGPTVIGHTARMLGRYCPPSPIVGAAHNEHTARKLTLSAGVSPVNILGSQAGLREVFRDSYLGLEELRDDNDDPIVKKENTVVITTGCPPNTPATSNLIALYTIR